VKRVRPHVGSGRVSQSKPDGGLVVADQLDPVPQFRVLGRQLVADFSYHKPPVLSRQKPELEIAVDDALAQLPLELDRRAGRGLNRVRRLAQIWFDAGPAPT